MTLEEYVTDVRAVTIQMRLLLADLKELYDEPMGGNQTRMLAYNARRKALMRRLYQLKYIGKLHGFDDQLDMDEF